MRIINRRCNKGSWQFCHDKTESNTIMTTEFNYSANHTFTNNNTVDNLMTVLDPDSSSSGKLTVYSVGSQIQLKTGTLRAGERTEVSMMSEEDWALRMIMFGLDWDLDGSGDPVTHLDYTIVGDHEEYEICIELWWLSDHDTTIERISEEHYDEYGCKQFPIIATYGKNIDFSFRDLSLPVPVGLASAEEIELFEEALHEREY